MSTPIGLEAARGSRTHPDVKPRAPDFYDIALRQTPRCAIDACAAYPGAVRPSDVPHGDLGAASHVELRVPPGCTWVGQHDRRAVGAAQQGPSERQRDPQPDVGTVQHPQLPGRGG